MHGEGHEYVRSIKLGMALGGVGMGTVPGSAWECARGALEVRDIWVGSVDQEGYVGGPKKCCVGPGRHMRGQQRSRNAQGDSMSWKGCQGFLLPFPSSLSSPFQQTGNRMQLGG